MTWRISVFGVLLALTIFANRAFEVVIDPIIDNQIAAAQLEDSELSIAQLRTYDTFANFVPLVTWGLTGLVGLVLGYTYLRTKRVES